MPQPQLRPLSVGEILDVAFGVYRRHLATLVTITVVLTALPLLLVSAGAVGLMPMILGNPLNFVLLFFLAVLVYVVLTQLAMGASVLVIGDGYLGRELGAPEAVRRTWGRLGLLVGSGILAGLVVGLGMLLILLPGIILLCGLIITTQVVMLESPDSATVALGRAWKLSQGYRWRMFLLLLVAFALTFVVLIGTNILVAALFGGFTAVAEPGKAGSMSMFMVQQGLQLLMNTLITPLTYCILTVAYYDLRVRKEAFDLEMLATSLPS